jgi:hypothetical protein
MTSLLERCNTVTPCPCRSHAQHLVFRTLWFNPQMTLKQVAAELRIPYNNVRVYALRVRERNLANRCPICFSESFFHLVCQSCGADLTEKGLLQEGVIYDSQSPVYRLQGGNGLGSRVDYRSLRPGYGAKNVQHLVERPDDPRIDRLKSRLWQGLKSKMPRDDICEDAVKMLIREYRDALRFEGIGHWRGLGDAILRRVWSRLVLLYPELPREAPPALGKKSKKATGQPDYLSREFDGESF